MIWPFSIFAGSKPCECAGEVKCNIISSQELRKIRIAERKNRLDEETSKIKKALVFFAKYSNDSETTEIYISIEFESLILEELAKCNINVDLSSRKLWDDGALRKVYGENYYQFARDRDKHNKIEYKVSF